VNCKIESHSFINYIIADNLKLFKDNHIEKNVVIHDSMCGINECKG
jgi:hypothetical protein